MYTTNSLLDEIKRVHSLPSDYKLGIVLDVSKNTIGQYRKGISRPDDRICLKLAQMLDLDPAYVVACIHAERAHDDTIKSLWISMANRLQAPAAAVLIAIFAVLLTHPEPSQAVDFASVFPLSLGAVTQVSSYTLGQVCCFFAYFGAVAKFSRLFPRI